MKAFVKCFLPVVAIIAFALSALGDDGRTDAVPGRSAKLAKGVQGVDSGFPVGVYVVSQPPTFTATVPAGSTITQTLTPTLTITPNFTPTVITSFFNPVSTTAPQTITTPIPNHQIELLRWGTFRGSSSLGNFEIFGCGPGNIATPGPGVIEIAAGVSSSIAFASGNAQTFGLNKGICFRVQTPVGPVTVGGVAGPAVYLNYRLLFVGSATPTVTPTPTP